MRLPNAVPIAMLLACCTMADSQGQEPAGSTSDSPFRGVGSVYGAPGFYGTSYGTASFGVPRLYSEFSSPYGLGYSYGYAPSTFAPNAFGVGLWRPGQAASATLYGSPGSYRTFPVQTWPRPAGTGPPFGEYAPAFGPTAAAR